jgi:hypothetical protein
LFFYLLQTLLLLKQVAYFMPGCQSRFSDPDQNLPNLLAGIAPESMADFAPESLADFTPELLAGFTPESLAGFTPE